MQSKRVLSLLPIVMAAFVTVTCWGACTAAGKDRPNVLFIAVDDLRPALGCYGDLQAKSPAIDSLAARGTMFRRAYCQQSLCNPSRASVMTGLRPDSIQVWDLQAHFRDHQPDVVTLPQLFKQHGYYTQSIGKVYHGGGRPAKDPPSWTAKPVLDIERSAQGRYATRHNLSGSGLKRDSTESADVPDNAYVDGVACDRACKTLQRLAESQRPFFLAVGFRKPHLPFCAPQRYWEMTSGRVNAVPRHPDLSQGAPELATRSWGELEGYRDIPDSPSTNLSSQDIARLRHGYYACVAYTDALVARLIDQLSASGLADRTIVVLWGDHGFHVGELGLWTKGNNFELGTRSPLVIYDPRIEKPVHDAETIVELLDIYPTLAELCELESPSSLEGRSLVKQLSDPANDTDRVAYSQFPRAANGSRHRGRGAYMGYAIRTNELRFVEWRDSDTGEVVAAELYDHTLDPHESKNRIDDETYTARRKELRQRLRSQFPISPTS
ncbi:sulfatase [Aeoliella sp. ICT_H6.2]|uniref:Sulfatase n=1 Tax=Aeoliella straminimaris TaxID=2954799 RepID=A0A9X2JG23_9BACT|nr:sulfatase [Aeoliella straminimaris]MCO6044276.1 sulfatase [Aeoliella straminimaris]